MKRTNLAALGCLAVLGQATASAGIKYWDNPDFKAFDVGDYVQDGLVVNYDGIRNAGPNATRPRSRRCGTAGTPWPSR